MKQPLWFTVILLSILFSCKNPGKELIQSGVIDIESGLENLNRLKVSDFGKTIRYIPLETKDEGLVGRNPSVKVLRNYIVIESQRTCLLFDKKDGSFITEIGKIGQGPQEFTNTFCWTDEKEEFLYFTRGRNQLIKYDMNGKFGGKIEFSTPPGLASYYLFTEKYIIGYFNEIMQNNPFSLGIFDKNGMLIDSIPLLYKRLLPKEVGIESVGSISVLKGGFTGKTNSGFVIIDYNEGFSQIYPVYSERIWKNNENIRFKENFVDTIYTVSDGKLFPTFVLNTGKYHWPIKDINSKQNTNERIFIESVYENDTFVFFQFVKGIFSDNKVLYNGLYHKQKGETKLGKYLDVIEDDLTNFMPFSPLGISTAGEFFSIVEAWKVIEWLGNNPNAIKNEKLSFLKGLNEDNNPVVILVE